MLRRIVEKLTFLIEPSAQVHKRDRRSIQFLSYLVASLIPLILAGVVITFLLETETASLMRVFILTASVGLAGVYVLTRTRHYHQAPRLIGVLSYGISLTMTMVFREPDFLFFLGLGILFSGFFQSWKETAGWMTAIIAGMLVLMFIVPELTFQLTLVRLYFIILVGAIAILYANIQKQNLATIEQRSSILSENARQLQGVKDELELRVLERTAELEKAYVQLQHEVAARRQVEVALRESEEKYRRLVSEANQGFFITDPEGRFTFANPALAEILGVDDPDQLLEKTFDDFCSSEMASQVRQKFELVGKQANIHHHFVIETQTPQGKTVILELQPHPIENNGKTVGFQGIVRDITGRDPADQALLQANESLRTSVEMLSRRHTQAVLLSRLGAMLQSSDSMQAAHTAMQNTLPTLFPNTSGTFLPMQGTGEELFPAVTWGPQKEELLDMIVRGDRCPALNMSDLIWRVKRCDSSDCGYNPGAFDRLCIPLIHQEEHLGVLLIQSNDRDSRGEIDQQLAMTCADHIALALSNLELRESLRQQSIRDPLTNLFNRRVMEEVLDRELHRARRNESSVGVIMVDVDYLKKINDAFGHEAGDLVLKELGRFFSSSIRAGDVACRYGGDEFVLILPGITLEGLERRATGILDGISELRIPFKERELVHFTASVGIAVAPEHGETAIEILRAADMAMYRAKHQSRTRIITATRETAVEAAIPQAPQEQP